MGEDNICDRSNNLSSAERLSFDLNNTSKNNHAKQVPEFFVGNILLGATFPGAPSYGGVKTLVEGSQTRGGSHIG